jgi:hypothetical protein
MTPDQKRVGTYFSFKGFQWEPLTKDDTPAGGPTDFLAHRQGTPCFRGAVLSLGSEQSDDTVKSPSAADTAVYNSSRHQLENPLKKLVTHYGVPVVDWVIPVVVAIVNHTPDYSFKNLRAALDTLEPKDLAKIHLFFWFDDFADDEMLFSQAEPEFFRMLYNWFHTD